MPKVFVIGMNLFKLAMLEGQTVISVGNYIAAPLAARNLADLGADVIKIENVNGGDPYRTLNKKYDKDTPADFTYRFLNYNRNKKSISIDLKTDRGISIIKKLAEDSDVIIENLSPGSMNKFGLSYEDLKEVNNEIVYCSISGYGASGPYKNKPALDPLIQASSGLAYKNKATAGKIANTGVNIVDILTAQNATISILSALLNKTKTQEGTHIDISLLDSAVSILNHEAAEYSATGEVSLDSPSSFVPMGIYQTKNGALSLIARDKDWESFCEVLGITEWHKKHELWERESREENRELINRKLSNIFLTKSTEYWISNLQERGVLVSPINSIEEVFNHPQINYRESLKKLEHDTMGQYYELPFPAIFSEYTMENLNGAPSLGENNEDILERVGYSGEDINQLYEDEIIFSYRNESTGRTNRDGEDS
jgi:crotonobetainyl-CoA:carnitine CoA-transferase CaiB-like acyl-CoA transferase